LRKKVKAWHGVLEVDKLIVLRRGRPLIAPVSFRVHRGAATRITGDNGTGKTTLLETLLGVHHEWKGAIRSELITISYKRQGAPAFESLTLRESALLVVGTTGERRARLATALGLSALLDTPVGLMSGGKAQRAMLFLAMLRENDLLLLDEPLVGVDPESADLIAACLKQHRGRSALLFVEHRPSQAFDVAEEIQLERAPGRSGIY
jgi:ABC-type Mn2+/Zn2+ transport system ATPase subunit